MLLRFDKCQFGRKKQGADILMREFQIIVIFVKLGYV